MGWADFGRALYMNASSAAGQLATTKLALRQEERADRQVALQEQAHRDTVAYQRAKMVMDQWLEQRQQVRAAKEMEYKQSALEWQMGSHERAIALETEKHKNQIAETDAKLAKEQEIKAIEAEKAQKELELRITEAANNLMAAYPELEESQAIAIVSDDLKGSAAIDAISRAQWIEDYKVRNPDASDNEILDAYAAEHKTPETASELDKMKAISQYREDVKARFAAGEMSQDQSDFEMKMIDKMAHGKIADDTKDRSVHDKYSDAVDKAVADGILSEEEGKKQKRDYLIKQAGGGSASGDGKYSPVSTIERYGAFTDSGELMSGIYLGSGTNDEKERNIRTLDMYLNGAQSIEDIPTENAPTTAQVVSQVIVDKLSKIRKDAVYKFDQSVIFTLQGAPQLWREYKRLEANGHEMGKLLRIRQGAVKTIGKTVHPDVTNFATHLGEFMETRLRLRTGAVINDQELANEMARQPNPFVDQDVSEGTMLGLLEFSYNYQRALYKSVAGEKWADFIMGHTQSETHELIDQLKPSVERPADVSRGEVEKAGSTWDNFWKGRE